MQPFPTKIRVDVARQLLTLLGEGPPVEYPVSTSGYGLGSEPGSLKTPTGRFHIVEKIGGGAPLGATFKGRLQTEEAAPPSPDADLIQTRILRLAGAEPHNANTWERYIYIHGTNHEEQIGTPCSHGCVRMRNADIARLYEQVSPGVEVTILEGT